MEEKTKPNCYNCIHRGTVPGSAHSSCNHPKNKTDLADPLQGVMAILASVGRVAPVKSGGVKVKGNAIGIRGGWFNYPFNFDPTWLEECDGYTPKEDDNHCMCGGTKLDNHDFCKDCI